MGVVIQESGLCAGFTSHYLTSSGSNFNADFGTVTNVDSGPTMVEVVVAFRVDSAAPAGSISEVVTIDGAQYSLPVDVVASPAVPGDVSLTAEGLGPTSFYTKFGAGLRTLVNIPADFSGKPLTFITYPDHSVTDVQLKVCRVEVESVGLGLPCLYPQHDHQVQAAVYSKRSGASLFDDVGQLELGSSCPADIASDQSSQQLAVSFFYEIPPQTLSPAPIVMTGGLYYQETALFSSYSLTTSTTELTGLEGWNSQSQISPYLTVRADTTTVSVNQPFPLR